MAVTPSNMLPLGTTAPDFKLLDTVSGETKQLNDLKSEVATVVMFICNHCPYVKHVREELVELTNKYTAQNISFIAISSNDADNYPDDGPEQMKQEATQFGFSFPYLYDETQEIAKSYQAACTPDFYVFDGNLGCVYRGRLDGATPGNDVPVTGKDLRSALDAVISGKPVSPDQQPSVGCNIKWK